MSGHPRVNNEQASKRRQGMNEQAGERERQRIKGKLNEWVSKEEERGMNE